MEPKLMQPDPPVRVIQPMWIFITMCILTGNVYLFFWNYYRWKELALENDLKIRPFWRAIFHVLFLRSLLTRIKNKATENNIEVGFSIGMFLFVYLMLFAFNFTLDPILQFAGLFSFVPFLAFHGLYNRVSKVDNQNQEVKVIQEFFSKKDLTILIGVLIAQMLMFYLLQQFFPEILSQLQNTKTIK